VALLEEVAVRVELEVLDRLLVLEADRERLVLAVEVLEVEEEREGRALELLLRLWEVEPVGEAETALRVVEAEELGVRLLAALRVLEGEEVGVLLEEELPEGVLLAEALGEGREEAVGGRQA